ncbi:MAG: hypothetical protein IJC66_11025 [Kiritimatiellae bacterium]|nr:hypothetical protein [Kiritimatiellia bacterium]MBR6587035.1 hypothetical protein [Kiritimatiellia bacterium]
MAKKMKKMLEVSLVNAELTSLPERKLLKSRNLVCVDMIWPRAGIARKSAAREATFRKGKVDFSSEEWAKRVVFREDVEARTAFAVSITEPVTVQKLKRFARLTAKYALRMGADFMEKAMVGYADIASAPMDALSAMVGEKDAPEAIAQGVVDFPELPADDGEVLVEVPLKRPGSDNTIGSLVLSVRG